MKVGPQTQHRTEKLATSKGVPHDPFHGVIALEQEEESAGEFFHEEYVLWCRAQGPQACLRCTMIKESSYLRIFHSG